MSPLPSKSLEVHHIVSALMLCGVLTMLQREVLLAYVDHHPETGWELALQLEEAAREKRKDGLWMGAKAARHGLEITVALRVSDLWRTSSDIRRNAQIIRIRAEQAIKAREQAMSQGQTLPRAA